MRREWKRRKKKRGIKQYSLLIKWEKNILLKS